MHRWQPPSTWHRILQEIGEQIRCWIGLRALSSFRFREATVQTSVSMNFRIGEGNWIDEVRKVTTKLDPSYWSHFRPVAQDEMERLEQEINRSLPQDFRLFWAEFGAGQFPVRFGGNIYTPEEIFLCCHGPLLMKAGSAAWASDEDQRRFYCSRGSFNPNPTKFTSDVLRFEEISLLDLLQIGTDGSCCYHQLFVGQSPKPFGYCLLTDDVIEDKAPSFSDGLRIIFKEQMLFLT